VQVRLIASGDRCTPHRSICPDQTRSHLVAGEGADCHRLAQTAPRFGDPNARLPLGVGLLGTVVLTRQQTRLQEPEKQPGETLGFDWLPQERIRALNATPIIFKGEVLGVIVGFTRAQLPEEARPWGRIFANHIGAAIANARAFEEIQRLKAQLELQNAYLLEEVVEARFCDLVGHSAALRQIVSQIELVAPTECPVLVLGETGTARNWWREIHCRSQRKNGPLVRVNCASIPGRSVRERVFRSCQRRVHRRAEGPGRAL
jgi:transcriptional regulator with GAF, ATPase, and Fis domain